jgi:TRAP-type uncharacterized transport system fused permease subunit
MQVHWEAVAKGIEGLPKEELPRLKDVQSEGWFFIVPAAALLYFLFVMLSNGHGRDLRSGIMLVVGATKRKPGALGRRLLDALQDTVSRC